MAAKVNIPEATLAALAPEFRAKLIGPSDEAYAAARKVHNGLIDKHPVAIARCTGVADVIDAVRLGLDTGLNLCARRRAQRRRSRGMRKRIDDRFVNDEGCLRRPAGTNGTRPRRRHLG